MVWQYCFKLEEELLQERRKSATKSKEGMHRRLKDPRTNQEVPNWDQETTLQMQKLKWFGALGYSPQEAAKILKKK